MRLGCVQNSAVADFCVSVSDAGSSAGVIGLIVISILVAIGGFICFIKCNGEYKNNL